MIAALLVLAFAAPAGEPLIEPEGARCHERYVRPPFEHPPSYGDTHWDHVVALREAWASGACTWERDRWRDFANDRENLIPATPALNISKGASDPAEWKQFEGRITSRKGRCTLLETHVRVKRRWELSMDPIEHAAVESMIAANGCRP